MNVAMISYHTCPLAILGGKNTGGMNVYVRELTRHLGIQNVHVDVFTRSENEHVPHVLHDLGFGNRVVHIPAGPEYTLSKKDLVQYLDEFSKGILDFSQTKGIQYDLIHSHYWMSGLSGIQIKKELDIPMIHMFHTLGLVKQLIARTDEEREGQYRLDGELEVIQGSDVIIGATESEKTQLIDMYQCPQNKIVIIPPGVDTSHFYPIPKDEAKEVIGIPKDDRMILFVGRIEPLKGIDTLIRSMALLKMECGKCPHYLVIIGGDTETSPEQESSELNKLRKLCFDLELDEVIIFLGKKGQDTLPYYYSATDVLVMPSHYESFGMVALEAMACGTPVIGSDVGGLSYLIHDGINGFLVPSQDPSALAEKLTNLLSDEQLQKTISHNAVEYANQYEWNVITDRVGSVYNSLN